MHEVSVQRAGARRRMPLLSGSSVRDLLLVGLTISSGAVDAISFLALGKVFTAFMTGNVVFLGLGLARVDAPSVIRVGVAIAAFAAGVWMCIGIVAPTAGSGLWPRRVSIALAVSLVAEAGFVACWMTTAGRPSANASNLLVGISGLAMGMQSRAVQSLGITGIFTTAATATVIILVNDLVDPTETAADRRRYAGVLVGLLAGAAAEGVLLAHVRRYAALLPLLTTLAVIGAACISFWAPERSSRLADAR